MSTKPIPLAFPSPACGDWSPEYGMTLRDWFAGQVLAAMVSTPKETTEAANAAGMSRTDFVTECAYQLADAMLKAREVTP